MKTIQINIRISETLASEIEQVSSLLKIDRSDWIRTTLAREAFEERNKLLSEVRDLEALMGSDIGRVFQQISKRKQR